MTEATGLPPPLHRKFNQAESLEYIRNRYRHYRGILAKQVLLLQQSRAFRSWVQEKFYRDGYKDWFVLSIIFNLRMNWEARKLGIPMEKEFAESHKMLAQIIEHTTESVQRFLDSDSELEIAFNV